MESGKTNKKSNKKIIAVIAAVIVSAIAAFSVHAGIVLSNDVIYDGVYAGKVNLSGMTEKQAKDELSNYFKSHSDITLDFECDGINFKITSDTISFKADIEKAVKAAYGAGRKGNLLKNYKDIMSYKQKSYSVPVEFSYDKDRLLLLINDNIQEKIADPVPMNVEIGDDRLYVTNSIPGKGIDEKKLFEDVNNIFEKFSDDTIDISIVTKEAKNLDYEEFYEKYNRDAKDALYTKTEESYIIEPEVVGITLDKSVVKKILSENKDNSGVYEIPAKITKPEITAKMLEDKYVNKIIATYSTSYAGSSSNRIANIALAASKINGYVINPGKRFSYNKVVGPRTEATGFKTAHVYVGNEVVDGIGGGICQVSSTLYNAAVMADLKIVSRTNHSMPVGYVPLGRDATVSYGSIDFVFENDKSYPISIKASASGSTLTVSIVGTTDMDYTVEFISETASTIPFATKTVEDPTLAEGQRKTISNGSNGYVANSYRVYKKNGKEYSRKYEAKSTYSSTPAKVAVGVKVQEAPVEAVPEITAPPVEENNTSVPDSEVQKPEAPQTDITEETAVQPPVSEDKTVSDDPLAVE